MRTFQLIFRNGLTRNIETHGFSRGRRGIVFMTPGGDTLRFSANELTKVEEVLDHATFPQKRARAVASKGRRSVAA